MSSDDIRLVQTCYPQIYLACHTRHRRAASSAHGLSARDSALLSHLDEKRPITPSALARHLGVGRPTMSAAIKRLKTLGYINVTADADDGRTTLLRLAKKGAIAMRETSVLEPGRVRRVLAMLDPADRRAALKGLALLAEAATQLMKKETRSHAESGDSGGRRRGGVDRDGGGNRVRAAGVARRQPRRDAGGTA